MLRVFLDCRFPDYLQRSPQTIPFAGRVELPEGSHATCRIEASKELDQVTVHDPGRLEDLPTTISQDRPQEVSFELDAEQEDRVLLVTMRDLDGVENRDPYRLVVSVTEDLPPDVSVKLDAIGSAVTPQARIPFAGRISDEYGIERGWYEYRVDESKPERREMSTSPAGRRELTQLGNFDLAATDEQSNRRLLEVKPGQRIALSVQAQDAYNLHDQPHVGTSQYFTLDIVTDSELRALLEKRELALRQRFEAIYEKMLSTRQLFDRIVISSEVPKDPAPAQEEPERQQERDRLRIGGAIQNVVQLSHETLGVADGFEQIVLEMENNRVDTAELKQRLQQGISDPLREVGGRLMPDLESQLEQLQKVFPQQDVTSEALGASKAQGDKVLAAMKEILDRMLELESYNELVELLRGIVSEHEDLTERTKKERRATLRGLLDED